MMSLCHIDLTSNIFIFLFSEFIQAVLHNSIVHVRAHACDYIITSERCVHACNLHLKHMSACHLIHMQKSQADNLATDANVELHCCHHNLQNVIACIFEINRHEGTDSKKGKKKVNRSKESFYFLLLIHFNII